MSFKKIILLTGLATAYTGLIAGGVEQNTNQSAEFLRMLNRNASTETDAVFYNPAGLAFMQDGLHLYISGQTVVQKTTATPIAYPSPGLNAAVNILGSYPAYNEKEYVGNTFVPISPSFYAAYKKDKLAYMIGFNIIGGGGSREYGKGIPTLHNLFASVGPGATPACNLSTGCVVDSLTQSFEGTSAIFHQIVGVTYRINEMHSVSVGGSYMQAIESREGSLDATYTPPTSTLQTTSYRVKYEDTGNAFGAFFGYNFKLDPKTLLALKYEWFSKLELERSNKKDEVPGLFENGQKQIRTLPQRIALGASYQILPALRTEASFSYWLNTSAGWRDVNGNDTTKNFTNSIETGLGAEYTISDKILVSAGGLYTKLGANDRARGEVATNIDSFSLATGGRYMVMPNLGVSLGYTFTQYLSAEGEGFAPNGINIVHLQRVGHGVAVGVNYRFDGV